MYNRYPPRTYRSRWQFLPSPTVTIVSAMFTHARRTEDTHRWQVHSKAGGRTRTADRHCARRTERARRDAQLTADAKRQARAHEQVARADDGEGHGRDGTARRHRQAADVAR